jgi:hypothetical protein
MVHWLVIGYTVQFYFPTLSPLGSVRDRERRRGWNWTGLKLRLRIKVVLSTTNHLRLLVAGDLVNQLK